MDIVERLRQEIGGYTDVHLEKAEADMREAADEIDRVRLKIKEKEKAHTMREITLIANLEKASKENANLREALKFCEVVIHSWKENPGGNDYFLLRAMVNARLALGEDE